MIARFALLAMVIVNIVLSVSLSHQRRETERAVEAARSLSESFLKLKHEKDLDDSDLEKAKANSDKFEGLVSRCIAVNDKLRSALETENKWIDRTK